LDELRHLDFFPRSLREDVNRMEEATERLTADRGAQPSVAAISDAAGLPRDKGARVVAAVHSTHFLSLDQRIARVEGDVRLHETIPTTDPEPEAMLVAGASRDELLQAIETLPPKERAALSFRYFGRLTQVQIAGMLGITHSRVCQIEKTALEHLRTKLTALNRV
jgi:RNA polymerase sigma factor for flagellar operon FliA